MQKCKCSEDGGFEYSFFDRVIKPTLFFLSPTILLIFGFGIFAFLR